MRTMLGAQAASRRMPTQRSRHTSATSASRYASRPPVSIESLALTALGQVRYALKTPYRDGDTHIELELLDLVARRTSVGLRARASRAGSEAGDANLTSRAGGLNLPVDARRREVLAAGHPVSSHSLPLRCYLR